VVPHRAQRAALQRSFPFLAVIDPEAPGTRGWAIDTVERFQGGERETILACATESDRDYVLAASRFLLDPRRLTVAISRARRKMILVAARSVFTLFSPDEETFQHARLWKNLLRRTCTELLWQGERHGVAVQVWGVPEGYGPPNQYGQKT
jgi:superfamily I DNA and/or RNA helicase